MNVLDAAEVVNVGSCLFHRSGEKKNPTMYKIEYMLLDYDSNTCLCWKNGGRTEKKKEEKE